jgi:S1-C subfamily serine protease
LHRTLLVACALVATLVAPSGAGQADDFSAAAIVTVKRSVAPIECVRTAQEAATAGESVSGTAFFINRSGAFVTADHVIQKMNSLGARCAAALLLPAGGWNDAKAVSGARSVYPFDAAACDEDYEDDVAACTLTLNPFATGSAKDDIAPVTFASTAPTDGAQVAFTGFPQGYAWPVTGLGSVASSTPVNDLPALTIDGLSWHGMSGCPVYARSGAVVGMLIGSEDGDDEGLSLARPAHIIVAMLRRAQLVFAR